MRLTSSKGLHPLRALRGSPWLGLWGLCLALTMRFVRTPEVAAQPAPSNSSSSGPASRPVDPLGDLVVPPGATRPLPRIALVPSLSADLADVLAHGVIERDLDLCGEVEILPPKLAPTDATTDVPVDMDAWTKTGVAAVIAVKAATSGDKVSLSADAYLVKRGATPVLTRKVTTTTADLRGEAHRTADLLIGALTGQNGGFHSHMAFVSVTGPLRTVFTMDSDGHDARAMSSPDELAIATAFGKGEELHWVSSTADGPYRIRTKNGPVPLAIGGSVYGLAFSKDRSRAAVSIATDAGIQMFLGPDLAHLQLASSVTPAVEPTFGPTGKLAFSGGGQSGLRVYSDGKPLSPMGTSASSPTVCNHPDGVRVIFAAGAGARTDLFSTGETGGPVMRLTQGQGANSSPACSPDGRLVAFFSTRKTGDGPGLYIARVDGGRPKRISTLLGSALRWDALPSPAPAAAVPALAATPATAVEHR